MNGEMQQNELCGLQISSAKLHYAPQPRPTDGATDRVTARPSLSHTLVMTALCGAENVRDTGD